MNEKAIQEADRLIHELVKGLQGMAVPAWKTYLMVIQANALVNLLEGVGWIIALAIVSFAGYKLGSMAHNRYKSCPCRSGNCGWFVGMVFGYMTSIAAAIVAFFTFFTNMFDIWNWIAIYNPQLFAAHQIIEKITSGGS